MSTPFEITSLWWFCAWTNLKMLLVNSFMSRFAFWRFSSLAVQFLILKNHSIQVGLGNLCSLVSVAVPPENKPKPEISLINMADVFLREDFQRRWLHVRSKETTTFPTSAILNTPYKYLAKWIKWEWGEKNNEERPIKKLKCPDFTTVKS